MASTVLAAMTCLLYQLVRGGEVGSKRDEVMEAPERGLCLAGSITVALCAALFIE